MENSHYCLRCGSILVGLENYINHRRFPCDNVSSRISFEEAVPCDVSKMEIDVVKIDVENRNFEPDKAPEKVGADDFFSSLELQSSSKTSSHNSNCNVNNVPSKSFSGIVTRSKTMLSSFREFKYVDKYESDSEPRHKKSKRGSPKKMRKSKKKKSYKKSSHRYRSETPHRKSAFDQLRAENDMVEASDFNKSNNDYDCSVTSNLETRTDENEETTSFRKYTPELYALSPVLEEPEDRETEVDKYLGQVNYEQNNPDLEQEEVDEYAPPRSHTGGKWTPGSLPVRTSPVLWNNQTWENLLEDDGRNSSTESSTESHRSGTPVAAPTGGRWKSYNPPSTYTGGKWKPSETPQTLEKVDNVPPSTHTGGKWKPSETPQTVKEVGEVPPSTYTGGKWKPSETPQTVEEVEDVPPETHTGGKWKPSETPQTVEEVEDVPPETHTGGKWKPSETPQTVKEVGEVPPSTYTGGKWKPSETPQTVKEVEDTPPSTHTSEKWKPSETPQAVKEEEDIPPETHTGGKWYPGKRTATEPPATHTGGKWKPQISSNNQTNSNSSSDPDGGPSSSKASLDKKALDVLAALENTSGKCVKTAGGLIHYYCSPCNRKLASKKIYKKHIMSELHLKRLLQEKELDFDSKSLKLFRGYFSRMKNQQRRAGKREVKKPQFFQVELGSVKRPKENDKCNKIKIIRLPRNDLIRCDVCKAKLASHQIGKHLVSYYHSRRINLDDEAQQKLVLDNIHSIIKHSPFQCGICKYYFNTHSLFRKHWLSEEHKSKEDTTGRKFWCVLCNFECDTSLSMLQHLDSDSHLEVIMAVNKSIPIIIRQKQILICRFCDKIFRYNIALIRHNRIMHGIKEIPEVHPCEDCDFKSTTVKSLQKHTLHRHRDTAKIPYYCTACETNFNTADEARQHRKSNAHKMKVTKETKTRICSICAVEVPDVEQLKIHIDKHHSDLRPKCSKCGRVFTLPQEIAQHKCSFLQFQLENIEKYGCGHCAYSSSLKADIIYHETLHNHNREDVQKSLMCPICGNVYRMFALKIHLRTHTGERPYKCQPCSKTFVRKSRLVAHLRVEHKFGLKEDDSEEGSKKTKLAERPKCGDPMCKYSSKDPEDMKLHLQVHKGRSNFQCQLCDYKSKTYTVLRRHNKIHFDEKLYQCPHCNFSGRLPAHLKRHMRLHTGSKPYKCPHCQYRCNNLENLRKHVMQTRIHPGKKLYDCKMCDFSTNTFQSFKKHVFEKHSESLGTEAAATAYIAGVYKDDDDDDDDDTQESVSTDQEKSNSAPLKIYRPATNQIIIARKLEPGDPRPGRRESVMSRFFVKQAEQDKKHPGLEEEKVRSRIHEKPVVRSYPSATSLKAGKELKRKAGGDVENVAVKQMKTSSEDLSCKESKSQVTVVVNETETQTDNALPSYIVYGSGTPFDDNEEQLTEKEFYLFENLSD